MFEIDNQEFLLNEQKSVLDESSAKINNQFSEEQTDNHQQKRINS